MQFQYLIVLSSFLAAAIAAPIAQPHVDDVEAMDLAARQYTLKVTSADSTELSERELAARQYTLKVTSEDSVDLAERELAARQYTLKVTSADSTELEGDN